jgi:hypothetical protein
MNTADIGLSRDYLCCSTDIFSLLGEPDDAKADWRDLRYIRFAGFDHIFFSSRINSLLANKAALEAFLLDVFQLLENQQDNCKFFLYNEKNWGDQDFFHFDAQWRHNGPVDFKVKGIESTREKKCIRTLFQRSMLLAEKVFS